MRRRLQLLFLIYLITFVSLLFVLIGCGKQQLYRDEQVLLGTFVEVISPDKRAAQIVFEEINKVEGLLSKYKENSDIWRLNKFAKSKVSKETIYVVKMAKEFWRETGGAFDITVAPLLELWGFKDKNFRLPEKGEIDERLKHIGSDKIIIDEENNIIEFQNQNMEIDLGGIAKGYALDCAVVKLRQAGIRSALLNAGGDIYCLGKKFSKPWKIAIKHPRSERTIKILSLKDKAVATSGDYEQYFVKEDKRYSHILDPKTGFPAESGVISVTVIADDCLTADASATSIFILGKDRAGDLAKRFNAVVASIVMQ